MKKNTSYYLTFGTSNVNFMTLLIVLVISQKVLSKSKCEKIQETINTYTYNKGDFGGDYTWDSNPITDKIYKQSNDMILRCSGVSYTKGKNRAKSPPLVSKWYKNEIPINEKTTEYKITHCSKNPPFVGTQLEKKNIDFGDSAIYKCVISGIYEPIELKPIVFSVLVTDEKGNSPPVLEANKTVESKDFPVNNVDGKLLYCPFKVANDSDVFISWYKEGIKLQKTKNVIEVCTPGRYTCKIENYLGQTNRTFIVGHKDLNCRSIKTFLLWMIGPALFLFVVLCFFMRTIVTKISFFKKKSRKRNLSKETEISHTYGMFVSNKELTPESEECYEEQELPITHNSNREYCLLSSFAKQFEDSLSVSKDDLKLVKDKEISRERLTCVSDGGKPLELGSGFFGSVFKGFLAKEDGTKLPVAIKILKTTSIGIDYGHFIEEAATLIRSEGHENVISLIGTCITDSLADKAKPGVTPKIPILVMELADGGNLYAYLRQCRERASQPCKPDEVYQSTANFNELVSICHQVVLGMKHLNEKKILHRDLAARNILLTKDKVVKIGDFGLSKHLLVKNYYRICSRLDKPVKWTSPEALLLDRYTVWSDVWSFGVLMWEVFSLGAEPYPTIQPRDLYLCLEKGVRLCYPELATDKLYQCMLSCWVWKPEDRMTFQQLAIELENIQKYPKINILKNMEKFPGCSRDQVQSSPVHSGGKTPSIKLVNHNLSASSSDSCNSSMNQDKTSTTIAAAKTPAIAAEKSFTNAAKSSAIQPPLEYEQNERLFPNTVDSKMLESETTKALDKQSDTPTVGREDCPYVAHKVVCHLDSKSCSVNYDASQVLSGVRDCLILENQSYQSRKVHLNSLGTPTGSDLSDPTENDSDETNFDSKRVFDVFLQSMFQEKL